MKRFDINFKPDWRKVMRAIDYARFVPKAGNKNVSTFLIVTNEAKIKMLSEASQQKFVGDVKMVVVVVSNEAKLVQSYDDRGKRYAPQQSGAAIENFLLGLVEQKLDTIWVGHFYPEQIHRELKIPDKMKIEAIFPIGRLRKNVTLKDKLKPSMDEMVYFEKWGGKMMNPPKRKD